MSLSKAFDKRARTLLKEYKSHFKSNKFNDKRIGENDPNLSLEEKMFKRFAVERTKTKDKSNKYNLNDDDGEDDELTHLGQNLAQIEKFEKVRLDEDDDDDYDEDDVDRGKINAKIVSENFFGGFCEGEDAQKRNRKEWIDEMIAKSKQLKYEKQHEREKTLDLTEKLDEDWKDMRLLISKYIGKNKNDRNLDDNNNEKKIEKVNENDYDMLVRTLRFDLTAQPTDKLKTSEELEKERLKKIKDEEVELIKRMNNDINDEIKKKRESKLNSIYRSPDDMDFNDIEYQANKSRKERLLDKIAEEQNIDDKNKREKEDDNEDVGEDDKSEKNGENGQQNNNNNDKLNINDEEWLKLFEKNVIDLNKKKLNVEDFDKYLKHLIDNKLNPGLNENNKERLLELSKNLINLYESEGIKKKINKQLLDCLSKQIFNLTHNYLKDKLSNYIYCLIKEYSINHNLKSEMLNLDKILFFKLISIIYPTSDYHHKITTPCLLLMCNYLSQSNIKSINQCLKGLFLANICYEYVKKSKRYIPECIQYLTSCIYLAADRSRLKTTLTEMQMNTILNRFRQSKYDLHVNKKVDNINELNLSDLNKDNSKLDDDKLNNLKITTITYCLDLLYSFANLYSMNVCFKEIFETCYNIIELLPIDNYPILLKEKIKKLNDLIVISSNKQREPLACLVKKPVILKLLEPKVETKSKFDPRHHNSVISEKQLNKKKYKKEYKAAIKEIRKDNQFLAKVQFDEAIEKDSKRKLKVKEIMGSLSMQEGEYRKFKRQKT